MLPRKLQYPLIRGGRLRGDGDSYESLPGYEKKTIRLNYWIDSAATANDPGWIWYYLTRDGQIGSTNTDVFTRI